MSSSSAVRGFGPRSALLLLVECASVSPSPDYGAVARLVQVRHETAPPWDSHGPEDDEVRARVDRLLAAELTPESAVEVALLRNRSLLATYESVGVAQADLVQAGLLANPSLSLHVGFPVTPAAFEIQSSVMEDFLSIFTVPLRKRLAERALSEAEQRVAAAVMALAGQVREAYFHLAAAQQSAALLREVVETEASSAGLAQRQFKAGNIPELDLASRQAALAQRRLELERAEAQVADLREGLARLMGVTDGATAWSIVAPLPDLPAHDPPGAPLEALALDQRLDLAALRSQADAAAQAANLAAQTRFVRGLGAGVDEDHDPERNTVVGPRVEIELPLFDQHQAEIARLEAQARAAHARTEALEGDIRSQVRVALQHVASARTMAESYEQTLLPLRDRVVKLSQRHYDAMLLGVYGLIQARVDEMTAQRGELDALRDYWTARIELELAVGGRLPETKS